MTYKDAWEKLRPFLTEQIHDAETNPAVDDHVAAHIWDIMDFFEDCSAKIKDDEPLPPPMGPEGTE